MNTITTIPLKTALRFAVQHFEGILIDHSSIYGACLDEGYSPTAAAERAGEIVALLIERDVLWPHPSPLGVTKFYNYNEYQLKREWDLLEFRTARMANVLALENRLN